MTIPAFGLGTFRLKDDVVIASVKTALELGYRAVDTAQIYDNEVAVGQAIAESGVPRNELYITTKIWIENLSKDKLIPSLKESLKKLRTDYVDLTLIHWPSPGDAVSVEEFMQALLEAKKQGLTREIGISNFTIPLMEKAIAAVGVDNIATNQIELSPYLQKPRGVLRDSMISVSAAAISCSICCTRLKYRSPSSVRLSCRVVRLSRLTPSFISSFLTARLTAELACPSCSAARLKLPLSTTATKIASSSEVAFIFAPAAKLN